MSTLSKLFVVLVFLFSVLFLGVTATLFAHRIDWKDKFIKETNYHYQTMKYKNVEIADMGIQLKSYQSLIGTLEDRIVQLDNDRANLAAEKARIARDLDNVNANMARLTANMDVYVRQLEVQLTQVQEMTNKLEEQRKSLARAYNERTTAVQENQYLRQQQEALSKDLALLEENHQGLAREKQRLQETIAHLANLGVKVDHIGPRKLLNGKVTAVSNEIGLVIISVGREDGVQEGDTFTVYRGANFVAKIVIDRVDRKWAAGRVVAGVKRDDPRVADDVSNNVMMSGLKAGE